MAQVGTNSTGPAAGGRITPATQTVQILYPSLWMGFSFLYFSLGEVMKRVRGATALGGAVREAKQTQTWYQISGLELSSWGHCCGVFNESLCVCLSVSSSITITSAGLVGWRRWWELTLRGSDLQPSPTPVTCVCVDVWGVWEADVCVMLLHKAKRQPPASIAVVRLQFAHLLKMYIPKPLKCYWYQ